MLRKYFHAFCNQNHRSLNWSSTSQKARITSSAYNYYFLALKNMDYTRFCSTTAPTPVFPTISSDTIPRDNCSSQKPHRVEEKQKKSKVFVVAVDCFILFSTLIFFYFFTVVLRKNLVLSQRRILRLMRLQKSNSRKQESRLKNVENQLLPFR